MVFFLSDKMFIQINNFRKLSLITSESESLNVKCAHSLVCLNFSFLTDFSVWGDWRARARGGSFYLVGGWNGGWDRKFIDWYYVLSYFFFLITYIRAKSTYHNCELLVLTMMEHVPSNIIQNKSFVP